MGKRTRIWNRWNPRKLITTTSAAAAAAAAAATQQQHQPITMVTIIIAAKHRPCVVCVWCHSIEWCEKCVFFFSFFLCFSYCFAYFLFLPIRIQSIVVECELKLNFSATCKLVKWLNWLLLMDPFFFLSLSLFCSPFRHHSNTYFDRKKSFIIISHRSHCWLFPFSSSLLFVHQFFHTFPLYRNFRYCSEARNSFCKV